MVWSGPKTGFRGVTELVECERTSDTWLENVQHEFRKGTLSDESHAFLHGYPTMNPGSTVAGIAACSTPSCVDRIIESRTYEKKSMKILQKKH